MQIGLLGLGKMGKQIAEKLMSDNHQVVVWNRTPEVLDQYRLEQPHYIVNQKLILSKSISDLRTNLLKPRVIWSMLPAGDATEAAMKELIESAEPGDVIIDGGNANFKDTERRAKEFEAKGIRFLGIGVSGGVHAKDNGCCLMVGGNKDAYEYITPLLDSMTKPSGIHTYFGTGGAGHFVKMVHNGIEYGMMQSFAEGFGVMAKSDYHLNLSAVGNNWQQGSIVASFLLQMVIDGLAKDPTLSTFDGIIGANGEGKWTVEQAKEAHLPIPVIEQSVEFRNRSQYDKGVQATFAAKLLSAMRKEFGGHTEKNPEAETPTK